MSLLKSYRGTQAAIDEQPITDGALLIATDTQRMFLDTPSGRVEVQPPQDVYTKEETQQAIEDYVDTLPMFAEGGTIQTLWTGTATAIDNVFTISVPNIGKYDQIVIDIDGVYVYALRAAGTTPQGSAAYVDGEFLFASIKITSWGEDSITLTNTLNESGTLEGESGTIQAIYGIPHSVHTEVVESALEWLPATTT